ncbi:hypothetical protein ENCLCK374B_02850 [Enterobacter cloacae]|nr:hypothetical protein AZZ64_002506 [Enterobacter cloacae]
MHSMSILSCLMVDLRTEDGLYLDEELVRFVPKTYVTKIIFEWIFYKI